MAKHIPWTRITNDKYGNYAALRKVITNLNLEMPNDQKLEKLLLQMISFNGIYPEDLEKWSVERQKLYINKLINSKITINFE